MTYRSPLGRELFRTYDEYGPLQVFDDGNRRYLSFGEGEEQSCIAPRAPHILQHDYTRAMMLPMLYAAPTRGLLLGLGGGALAHALLHANPTLEVTAVELRRAVIDIARRWFDLPRVPRLVVVNDDAGEFLEAAPDAAYDLICSDLYGSDGPAHTFFQPWFIVECARVLRPGGWLALNCWLEHRNVAETLEALRELFGEIQSCVVPGGNWVILASLRPPVAEGRALQQLARARATELGYSLLQAARSVRRHALDEPLRPGVACTWS